MTESNLSTNPGKVCDGCGWTVDIRYANVREANGIKYTFCNICGATPVGDAAINPKDYTFDTIALLRTLGYMMNNIQATIYKARYAR